MTHREKLVTNFAFSNSTCTAYGAVVLTSQCWDRGLHDRAARRLAEGLTAGALVVDYGRRLADAEGEAFGEPIATLCLPVSWNSGQKFCVFRRR